MPLRLAALLLLAAPSFAAPAPKPAAKAAPKPFKPSPEKDVEFRTSDGWALHATWRPAQLGRATVVLAHGVASSRREWGILADRLAKKGVGVFAVDLRGHGDSTAGPQGKTDFLRFDATGGWPRAVEDLRAAAFWLKTKGVPEEKLAFGGASIGANLAAVAALERPKTRFLLLLSPAADYRGVRLEARKGLKTFAAAAPTDGLAMVEVKALKDSGVAETLTAPRGHGVQMLEDAAALDAVVAWTAEAAK